MPFSKQRITVSTRLSCVRAFRNGIHTDKPWRFFSPFFSGVYLLVFSFWLLKKVFAMESHRKVFFQKSAALLPARVIFKHPYIIHLLIFLRFLRNGFLATTTTNFFYHVE